MKPVMVSRHGAERVHERIGIDPGELALLIQDGRAVRLFKNGPGNEGRMVRSAFLVYLEATGHYCVAIQSDITRTVITVLTEEMAKDSRWGDQINDYCKIRARMAAGIAVTPEEITAAKLASYGVAPQRLVAMVCRHDGFVKRFDTNLSEPLTSDQLAAPTIALAPASMEVARNLVDVTLSSGQFIPFADLFVDARGRLIPVEQKLDGIGTAEEGSLKARWLDPVIPPQSPETSQENLHG